MSEQELGIILEKQRKWLNEEPGGQQADFSGMNFSGVDLPWIDFSEANLNGVDFSRTNLNGANLYKCNLFRTNFSEANLTGANLTGANLNNTIGNGKEIKTIMTDGYIVNYTDKILQIGCQQYPIKDWFKFTDKEISEMDDKDGEKALRFWSKWKPILQMILESQL